MAKLRCLLMKLASVLEEPLRRMQQQSLPGFGAAQEKLTHTLHGFAQQLLQVLLPRDCCSEAYVWKFQSRLQHPCSNDRCSRPRHLHVECSFCCRCWSL